MPAPAKKHETANVAVPTPVKIAPAAIALEGSHAAEAEAAGNPGGEAKVDIHALLTSTDAEARATAADELTNLVSENLRPAPFFHVPCVLLCEKWAVRDERRYCGERVCHKDRIEITWLTTMHYYYYRSRWKVLPHSCV